MDLVDLAKRLGYGKIVIRFGDTESMLENLAVAPGNVTPLALAYDEALLVNVALDKKLFDAGAGEAWGGCFVVRRRCRQQFPALTCLPPPIRLRRSAVRAPTHE